VVDWEVEARGEEGERAEEVAMGAKAAAGSAMGLRTVAFRHLRESVSRSRVPVREPGVKLA
jgi:hypothetical protein